MLVTACALGVEPKLMHALVWQQSGGEPWAVSVPNGTMPRVYSSMQQAISETRTASVAPGIVRVGLAGLPVAPSKASPAMFLPCRNVAIAATTPPPSDLPPGTASASDERERGWSSALFPPKPKPRTKDSPNDEPIAQEAPSVGVTNAHPFAAKAPADSLFVLRSSDRRP
jgi:hypothetical protein